MPVVFALSGGGARAAAQVGVLRALAERDIVPDLVIGASAGAVNGAWYSLFPNGLDDLETVWLGLTKRRVFPGGVARNGYHLIRHGHLNHIDSWARVLDQHYSGSIFERTRVPFIALTVRLKDGMVIAHDRGPISPVLKASTAVPGLFPPQPLDGELHVDGAVVEFLPIPTAIRRGASHIYAIDSSDFAGAPHSTRTAIDRCGQMAASAWVHREIHHATRQGVSVVHLRPPVGDMTDGRDFSQTARLLRTGYEHAVEQLARSVETRDPVPV